MEKNNFTDYTVEELMVEPSFRVWVLEGNTQAKEFWEAYQVQFPDQTPKIKEAKISLLSLHKYFEIKVTNASTMEAYQQLQSRLKDTPVISLPKKANKKRRWLKVAGMAVLLSLASLLALYVYEKSSTPLLSFDNGYGIQTEHTLPDGSIVQLNSNSKLKFTDDWEEASTREVWLEGEAYFTVKKDLSTQRKFVVHTTALDVEVYGTQFNVNTRRFITKVVLEEGKVELKIPEQQELNRLEMKPGDIFTYNEKTQEIAQKRDQTDKFTSWKDGILSFEAASLEEVLLQLQDIYEIKIRIVEKPYKEIPIRAIFPVNNWQECQETLELLLISEGLSLKTRNDTLYIE